MNLGAVLLVSCPFCCPRVTASRVSTKVVFNLSQCCYHRSAEDEDDDQKFAPVARDILKITAMTQSRNTRKKTGRDGLSERQWYRNKEDTATEIRVFRCVIYVVFFQEIVAQLVMNRRDSPLHRFWLHLNMNLSLQDNDKNCFQERHKREREMIVDFKIVDGEGGRVSVLLHLHQSSYIYLCIVGDPNERTRHNCCRRR